MLRASFEETVEVKYCSIMQLSYAVVIVHPCLYMYMCEQYHQVFMNAAAFSQLDKLNGVTENVMLGQLGRFGSGFVDLLLVITTYRCCTLKWTN